MRFVVGRRKAERRTARDLVQSGDEWRHRVSRLMLVVLLEHAIQKQTITYGGMARLLLKRYREPPAHAASYGKPAGRIGDVLVLLSNEWGENIPPLNAILVNQRTKVAGSGADYYLRKFAGLGKLTAKQRQALAEDAIDAVFDYQKLTDIAKHFDLTLSSEFANDQSLVPIEGPPGVSRGSGGEKAAHKDLKLWVMHNPQIFKQFGVFGTGKPEFWLDSGDEIDVLFQNERAWLGVEVKAGDSEPEMWRGVFQCIKYRALLRAICKQRGLVPIAQSILVIDTRPSERVRQLAKRLNVNWINVSRLRRRATPGI